MTEGPERWIEVEVEDDLQELVPGYLDKRRGELAVIEEALVGADFATLRRIGHDLKGTGGGYGFDAISDVGRALEQAAKDQDAAAARVMLERLRDFLARVRVVYVEA